MREIKFRAWDKKRKSMQTSRMYAVHFDGSLDMAKGRDWWRDKDFILMQFTGLHDKNGRGIFDGDICKIDGGADEKEICPIVWSDKHAQWHCEVSWLKDKKETAPLMAYIDMSFCNIEVIGNIYENPELLKG